MSLAVNTQYELAPGSWEEIDREIAKYPEGCQQSAIIAALSIAQRDLGWLPKPIIESVARYLDMAPIAAWEVASFYTMFNTQPVGKHKLSLCTNLPCQLSGANQAAVHLKRTLGINFGQTTQDGEFTLKESECLGACGDAPVLLVNDRRMVSFMSSQRLDDLVNELKS